MNRTFKQFNAVDVVLCEVRLNSSEPFLSIGWNYRAISVAMAEIFTESPPHLHFCLMTDEFHRNAWLAERKYRFQSLHHLFTESSPNLFRCSGRIPAFH